MWKANMMVIEGDRGMQSLLCIVFICTHANQAAKVVELPALASTHPVQQSFPLAMYGRGHCFKDLFDLSAKPFQTEFQVNIAIAPWSN